MMYNKILEMKFPRIYIKLPWSLNREKKIQLQFIPTEGIKDFRTKV